MYCNLPGPVQTVPRGEVYALLLLLEHAEAMSDIEYVTDNEGLHKTFNAGPRAGRLSNNCDLYHAIFKMTYEKAIRLRARWMPSHLSEKDERPVGVSLLDIKGNDQADKLAEKAAATFQLPLQPATNYLYYVGLVQRIQRRLVAVIMALPERLTTTANKEDAINVVTPILSTLLQSTSHSPFYERGRYKCTGCGNSFGERDPNLRQWLRCPCPVASAHGSGSFSAAPATCGAAPVQRTGVAVAQPLPSLTHAGNNQIHHTHSIYCYRGLPTAVGVGI